MRQTFAALDQAEPVSVAAESVEIVCFSASGSEAPASNEDAAGIWEPRPGVVVVAVADGLGGGPQGAEASALAIEAIDRAVYVDPGGEGTLRGAIVDAFEQANAAILEAWRGAGTTLVVVEIVNGVARSYHAGASGALVVGQRGRVRMETLHH